MTWIFNPFTGTLDYCKEDIYTIESHNADVNLTSDDFKKIHVFDVSGGEKAVWLPDISSGSVGQWIIIVRKQKTGSLMRVWASGTDIILNSSAGGYLQCADTDHDYCSILLVVVENGKWFNPSFGIWSSH